MEKRGKFFASYLSSCTVYDHPGSSNVQHTGQGPFLSASAKRLYSRISDVTVFSPNVRRTTQSIPYKSLPSHFYIFREEKGAKISAIFKGERLVLFTIWTIG